MKPEQFGEIQKVLQKQGHLIWQGVHRRKDGSTFPVEVTIKLVRLDKNYMVTTARDITERERAERALADKLAIEGIVATTSTRFLAADDVGRSIDAALADVAAFCRSTRASLVLIDRGGTAMSCVHEWCAPGAASHLGIFKNRPLDAMPWCLEKLKNHEIVHVPEVASMPEYAGAEKKVLEAWGIGSVLVIPLLVRKKLAGFIRFDDVTRDRDWRRDEELVPLRTLADIIGMAIERRRADDERSRLEGQLRHQQKLEAIGTLASGVAHEINNPITAILNFAEIIEEEVGEESELRDFAGRIVDETNRVAGIVKNLLSFARQDKEHYSPASIPDIVRDTLTLIAAVFRKDQIAVGLDLRGDLPKINCRSQQIRQVLMNLLTNARDALNDRYPSFDERKIINISCGPVEIDGAAWIRTTVENHGAAIPPEVMGRIFDPFFTTKPKEVGTGLGLAISYGIVKDHGGLLWAESGEAATRFHIDLKVQNGRFARGPMEGEVA
ncbi:MAG: ATP-binding protein [Deltaproteobacteria bacterium]|nr:ATP-binding protein [Deltaproteobacteria bacterium]